MKRTRAVAIVINNDQILLIYRVKNGEKYYVFPGGGVKTGETVKEAVLRELLEETCLKAKIKKLLYIHDYGPNYGKHYFYLCETIEKEPKLGDDCVERKRMSKDNFYNPLWLKIKEMKKNLIYPLEIRDWLIKDLKNGFPNKPRKAKLKIEDLRQSL